MKWNVNADVFFFSQLITVLSTNKPLYSQASNKVKKHERNLFATSHCLSWKIRPCQMPVEWPDSKGITRLENKLVSEGPKGPDAKPRLIQIDNTMLRSAASPVYSHCHLFFTSAYTVPTLFRLKCE